MAQYEINIAKKNGTTYHYDGKNHPCFMHYCRICIDVLEKEAREMLSDTRKRYPVEEGFQVTMTHYQTIGTRVE